MTPLPPGFGPATKYPIIFANERNEACHSVRVSHWKRKRDHLLVERMREDMLKRRQFLNGRSNA